ncbi:UNVERIFIED_CONTAM: hypothetical protein RMT77_013990 [Armadillidium vulgare]
MVSRLEDLCGIQFAIELANELEFKKENLRLPDLDFDRSLWYDGNEPWFENMEMKVLEALEKLPFGLREKIPISVVIFCLTQSIEWAKFHNEEFDLPFDYSCSFLRSSFFTSKGILNEEKAAREIIKDNELSPSLKFCIACHYCLSDVIPDLWEQLPEDKRPKIENKVFKNGFCIGGRNEMADIWSYLLLRELQMIMEKTDDSFSLYKFKKTFDNESFRNCSDVAFKKCFEELSESEKEEAVIFTRDKFNYFLVNMETFGYYESDTNPVLFTLQLLLPFQKYLEIAIFFLRNLNERQLKVFFQPVMLHYVLFHLLSWPYQHMFMNVMSQFWEVLPKIEFCLLLRRIVRLMKNKSSSRLCNYHNILRDFWIQSSSSLRTFFFILEGIFKRDMLSVRLAPYENDDDGDCYFITDIVPDSEQLGSWYVIYNLFDSPFTIEDEKFIRLIFSSATLEEKFDIVRLQGNRIGKISFETCDLRRIDLFIECCVPKRRIKSFKKKLFNDEYVKEVLLLLILDNKGKEFQKILNWAFSLEKIKEWLQNFLYVRQEWKLPLYSCKKVKCIDKSLEWALSANEIQNLKKGLILDMGDIVCHFKHSLSKGDFQDIDFFLEWIFSSEIEMVKFKKDLIFESIRYIDNSFLSSGLSSLKKLIKWSALSKEEGKDFKRRLSFSEKVIEYYRNLVAQRQLCKANAFIRWAELTETEVKNFKRLLVFNAEGNIFSSCVSFILNGKGDFVKKLINWTQFSKEEVREFYSLLTDELNLYTLITEENTKLNDIKKIFNGFPLSEKEIERHKKDILFKSINLIEYFVMENRWDEMEELLGWCFSSETEIGEFKKKIPLKINNIIFLNLILCLRFEDVDKFFTWTGVHNSLKKRLLKKIIYDSRVYQIILRGFISTSIIEGLLNFLSANYLLSNEWKESFLTWYDFRKRRYCSDANCHKIRRPDIEGFEVHLDYHRLCDGCRSFIENSKRFIKLVDEHNNKLKVRPKRKLKSFLQINSTETKRSRHC